MSNQSDLILLVDENGRPSGEEDKEKCHEGEGILHGAFLVMVFNEKGELMLARRSARKKLWPHYWDGTLASHYRRNVALETTVRERIFEEIGVRAGRPRRLFDFRYQVAYRDIGSENERCDVFVVDGVPAESVALHPDEISACRYLGLEEVAGEAGKAPEGLTPWFLIALRMYLDRFPGVR
jgi:isopentenyl-diphosphate Delta-isomerase